MIFKFKRIINPYKMAILSVFIAILSITIVSIISAIGSFEIDNELSGLGLNGILVNAKDLNDENITDDNVYQALKEYPEVVDISPVIFDYASIEFSNSKKFETMAWGISNDGKDIVNLNILYGEFFSEIQTINEEFVCVIDEELAQKAYGRSNVVGKGILLDIGRGIYNFEIIGVCQKSSNLLNNLSVGEVIPNFVYIPYSIMKNNGNKDVYDQIIINTTDKENLDDSIMDYLFKNIEFSNELTLTISNLSKQKDTINNIVDIAFIALFLVSSVAIIVCSISVATSVTTAVNIQKKDIGIKISLGASRLNIMLEFLAASILASIIGIVIGVFFGFIILVFINLILENNYIFNYSLLILGVFVTIFLTGVFSIYPSYKAAVLTPVEALNRY